VRHIDCSDFFRSESPASTVLEADTDEELLERARAHTREEHPGAELDDACLREAVAATARPAV